MGRWLSAKVVLLLAVLASAGVLSVLPADAPVSTRIAIAAASALCVALLGTMIDRLVTWALAPGRRKEEFARLGRPRVTELPEVPYATMLRPDRDDEHLPPFAGRHDEMEILEKWCHPTQDSGCPVGLITGPGGVGKTRLALELAKRMEGKGWKWQLTGDGHEAEAVTSATGLKRVLLIVDYAETRTGLPAMFTEIARVRALEGKTQLRVLLIARSKDEWWDRLADSDGRALAEAVSHLELPSELDPHVDPFEVMREAARVFAVALKKPGPPKHMALPADPRPPVLVLHAAALVQVLDGEQGRLGPRAMDAEGILRALLGHERRLWTGHATRLGVALDAKVLADVMAVLALLAPEDKASAHAAVRRVPDLADADDERCGKVVRWANALYPGRNGPWLEPLRPDLVAERHVIDELGTDEVLRTACLTGLPHGQAVHALTVLARACALDDRAFELIDGYVRADPDSAAIPAITVTIQSEATVGRRIGQTLADVLETADRSSEELDAIAEAIPFYSTSLADAAASIAVRRLKLLNADQEPERVLYIQHQAITQLGHAGRLNEARSVAQASFLNLDALARQDREFPPLLGVAVIVDLCRVLDGDHAFAERALLAISLAERLFERLPQHERERALGVRASIMIYRCRLLRQKGDANAAEVGRIAVSELSQLSHPDPVGHKADLAWARQEYALALSDTGDAGKAADARMLIHESVKSRRELAGKRPDMFLPELARSLEAQAEILWLIPDTREMAVDSITEAIDCFTGLADNHRRFQPELAYVLHTRAYIRWRLDPQREDHQADSEMAIRILRPLARREPARHMGILAHCLLLSAYGPLLDIAFVADRLILARGLARQFGETRVVRDAEYSLSQISAIDPEAIRDSSIRWTEIAIRSWLEDDSPDAAL
jgi:Mrp family chromosome partitioning ATPase